MSTDAELLRRYAQDNSEAAFAELVRRHLSLVYFAALRQVGGDAHRAEEVAQSVFTDLARKARMLTGHATLTGWLHTSTRFAAAKARRADFSRQHHEREASTMNALLSDSDSSAEWERLRPTIDEAIQELGDRDREAVLLRFFENLRKRTGDEGRIKKMTKNRSVSHRGTEAQRSNFRSPGGCHAKTRRARSSIQFKPGMGIVGLSSHPSRLRAIPSGDWMATSDSCVVRRR